MTAYDVIVLACVVLAGACITLVLLLLATRIAVNLKTQRDERVMAPIRLAMLTMATCEDDDPDVETARGTLGSLPRKRQADFHELGYAMLARLHGETRDRLCALLVEDGAHRRATRMATSRRIDQRCLGLHHLGLLGRPATRHLLSGAVEHNDRDIRRVALQSATGYGTGAPVLAMLEAAVQEPTLRRDFLGAIAVLGRDATDEVLSALDALSQAQQRGWMS